MGKKAILLILFLLPTCKQRTIKDPNFFDLSDVNTQNLTRQQKCEYKAGGIYKNQNCKKGKLIKGACLNDESKVWVADENKCFPKKIFKRREQCLELIKNDNTFRWVAPNCINKDANKEDQ